MLEQTFATMDTMVDAHALPPLGDGLPMHSSLKHFDVLDSPPPTSSIASRGRAHLEPIRAAPLNDPPKTTAFSGGAGSGNGTAFLSPPPSPPLLGSPVPSRGVPKMGSMDDTYCDRIRSTSSFGWYDETAVFESVDASNSKTFSEIADWRNLDTWEGGREKRETQEEAANVEFVVPNAQVTTSKSFRHANHGQPEPYMVSIGSTRVRRMSPFAVHAEYQVLMTTKDGTYKSWKRFSDFKLLAEYAKISDLRSTVTAWRRVQQTQRWFRCLEANYLKSKCRLLERFLAQLLFELPTPSLLMNFVSAQQPGFARSR